MKALNNNKNMIKTTVTTVFSRVAACTQYTQLRTHCPQRKDLICNLVAVRCIFIAINLYPYLHYEKYVKLLKRCNNISLAPLMLVWKGFVLAFLKSELLRKVCPRDNHTLYNRATDKNLLWIEYYPPILKLIE